MPIYGLGRCHFKGLYTLTAEDIVEAKVFDDWIDVHNYFNFDIHNTKGNGQDANGAQKHFRAKGEYTIPYRCLVPEKVDGLLLSGRNISGTHKAHSNFRVMTICLNTGYGAGVAASSRATLTFVKSRRLFARPALNRSDEGPRVGLAYYA